MFLKTYNQINQLNNDNDIKEYYKIYNDFKKKLNEKFSDKINFLDFSKINLIYEFEKKLELLEEQKRI